jgi:magnesium chelatase subunit D
VVAERIAALGGGGGTPLRHAFETALACCERERARIHAAHQRILLLTDGRSRDSLSELAGAREHVELWVVDCERGPIQLGLASSLAAAIGASYYTLDQVLAQACNPAPRGGVLGS